MKNHQILAAVLNKWAQPLVGEFVNRGVQNLPVLQALQNKVRTMGWTSPQWTLASELGGVMEGITGSLVVPMLNRYLSQLDDESLPQMAHQIVDQAMKQGHLTLFEGNIIFDEADLKHLKRLLELNLPLDESTIYKVKEDEVQGNAGGR
jgi:hypothetical protein